MRASSPASFCSRSACRRLRRCRSSNCRRWSSAVDEAVLQIVHHARRRHLGDVHVATGVRARQEAVAPIGQAAARLGSRRHRDEAGQVLIVGAETVREPRAHARPIRLQVADVHHQHRAGMLGNVGVHAVDEADVVDALADFWKMSLTHLPIWPYCRNLYGDGNRPFFVFRKLLRSTSAGRSPACLAISACNRTCRPATARPA